MHPDQFILFAVPPLYMEALDEFWYSTAVPLVERTRVGTCASRFSVNTLRGIQSDASCHDTKGSQLMFTRCVPLSSDCGISKIDSWLLTYLPPYTTILSHIDWCSTQRICLANSIIFSLKMLEVYSARMNSICACDTCMSVISILYRKQCFCFPLGLNAVPADFSLRCRSRQ